MRDAILSFPAQLAEGIRLGTAQRVQRAYRTIVSTGMGGSAIAGELLSMVRNDIVVHWDYDGPTGIGAQDLVICASWSGDTEETLSSYDAARRAGAELLCITSGGILAEHAKADGVPLILLPRSAVVPRLSVGYMVGALFAALGMEEQLPAALDIVSLESEGTALAERLGDRMLALYAAYPWRKLTGFWKLAYSETTKRQVMANWFPSGAHTEVVGWEGPYQERVAILLFHEASEPVRYAKNADVLLALLEKKGYTVHTIQLSGSTVLERALRNYVLALWTSYHVAQNLHVDPLATPLLDEFKKLKALV